MAIRSRLVAAKWRVLAYALAGAALVAISACDTIPGGSGQRAQSPYPRYNAVFRQDGTGLAQPIFEGGLPSEVEFYLGPIDEESLLPEEQARVNRELLRRLREQDETSLVVRMTCWVCEHSQTQSAQIVYDRAQVRSTSAVFQFTPVASEKELGSITFEIVLDGRYYDNVVAEVSVGSGQRASPLPRGLLNSEAARSSFDSVFSGRTSGADLEIELYTRNSSLHVGFVAISDDIKSAFGGRELGADGSTLYFDSGVSPEELYDYSSDYFKKLAVIFDGIEAEQQYGLEGALDLPDQATLSGFTGFSDEDRDAIVDLLHLQGRTIYREIFVTADPSSVAAALISEVEKIGNSRTLRIRISSNGVYLPWQTLSGNRSADEFDSFWGVKYIIAVQPLRRQIGPPITNIYGKPRPRDSLFAVYRGSEDERLEPNWDQRSVFAYGKTLAKKFFSSLSDPVDDSLPVVTSNDSFEKALSANSSFLSLIVSYSHAQTSDARTGTTEKIFFTNTEHIRPSDITRIAARLGAEQLFPVGPFVLLNGCETGATGFAKLNNASFIGTFLRNGAGGIVTTESKVVATSSYQFADYILDGFLEADKPVPDVVTEVRRFFWYGESGDPATMPRNPIGLLYAYHGSLELQLQD